MEGEDGLLGHGLPFEYWSMLSAPSPLTIQTQLSTLQANLETIQQQQADGNAEPRSYFTDRLAPVRSASEDSKSHTESQLASRPYSKIASPTGTRACSSSLLSELLKMSSTPAGAPDSPQSVGTHGELVSDHGSISTRSTPPIHSSPPPQAVPKRKTCISFACTAPKTTVPAPVVEVTTAAVAEEPVVLPKRTITFACGQAKTSPEKKPVVQPTTSTLETAAETPVVLPKRTISFACGQTKTSPEKKPAAQATTSPLDTSNESTPVPKRTIQFASAAPARPTMPKSALSDADHSSDGQPVNQSACSSRRPSIDSVLMSDGRRASSGTLPSGGNSPVLQPRQAPTCKSTLDAMLQKEKIAKVIEPVLEEDEDEDEQAEDDDGEDDVDEDDEDEELDAPTRFELDSDDDGYVEDVESDEDPEDETVDNDFFPTKRDIGSTPRQAPRFAHLAIPSHSEEIEPPLKTPVYRPACPSESDLPDTTDFAPGTLDEDQPACVAFDCAVRDRALARRIATPQDIDPTFPDSGSDSDSEAAVDRIDAQEAAKKARRGGRSPCAKEVNIRLNSPPPARKHAWAVRARSLPARRTLGGRKQGKDGKEGCLYPPKPQRAVTIKQSNEQRAQRRRDKRELRHHLQGGPKPAKPAPSALASGAMRLGDGEACVPEIVCRVDTSGHEKMKAIGCKTRKQTENPCLIRPVMSI